ncbi:hypothetical protein NQ318_008051 [Aromia moschata]|uniref:PRELI/MSF1 domain-containing protein n=1 Tax=Aromia moschata TaxID=1265417 RepID=A0AAV8XDK6_9CUCU|nr:hypothetical protein NQ318_008051 [Aromia moschata]
MYLQECEFAHCTLMKLIGSAKICYASEQSEVNPASRHMVLKTINLTFCRHIAVDETLKYIPHPSDSSKTLLKQEAVVMVKGVPLTNYMEDLLTNKISKNAGKGRQAMESVINKINEEVKDLTRSTDEIFNQTKKSLDDIASSAKKSMDGTFLDTPLNFKSTLLTIQSPYGCHTSQFGLESPDFELTFPQQVW